MAVIHEKLSCELAKRIREIAREELMPRFTRVERFEKQDGSFVSEADLAIQKRMSTELSEVLPGTPFLGEEMGADEQLALISSNQPLLVFDPLDGTTNFVSEIPYFSLSLALIADGRVALGIVYDPNRDECFTALPGEGAYLNGKILGNRANRVSLRQSTALVDFKRLPDRLSKRLVTETPYASQRSFGSVALDLCWIAAGRCDLYLHGRSNIWDYAAGILILQESGGFNCTLDGEPVFTKKLVPRSIVAAAEERVFCEWCEWLGITQHG